MKDKCGGPLSLDGSVNDARDGGCVMHLSWSCEGLQQENKLIRMYALAL